VYACVSITCVSVTCVSVTCVSVKCVKICQTYMTESAGHKKHSITGVHMYVYKSRSDPENTNRGHFLVCFAGIHLFRTISQKTETGLYQSHLNV